MANEFPRQLICIACPVGCELTIEKNENGELAISGNKCKRGISYGTQEVTKPMRILTTTVALTSTSGARVSLPVRSLEDIPRELFPEAMQACEALQVSAPVAMGQVLIEDLAGSGVPLVASRDMG